MTRLELAEIRQRYGFTYRKLAEFTGEKLSVGYLNMLEKGAKPLTPELEQKIMQGIYAADMARSKVGAL